MSMKVYKMPVSDGTVSIENLVELFGGSTANLRIGSATFPAGTRHPETGYSVHDHHEVSLILSGEIGLDTPDGSFRAFAPGDLVHIEPGEEHAPRPIIDSQVLFILFGDAPHRD